MSLAMGGLGGIHKSNLPTVKLGKCPEGRGVCPHCGRPWHEGLSCLEEYDRLPKIPRSPHRYAPADRLEDGGWISLEEWLAYKEGRA